MNPNNTTLGGSPQGAEGKEEWKLVVPQPNPLVSALVKAQAQMKPCAKSGNNPHFKSKFSTLEDVWDCIREPLTQNGLAIVQSLSMIGDKWVLETKLLHVSGLSESTFTPILTTQAGPQGFGSALSYARRYAIMALVGVSSSEDDDGETASGRAAGGNGNATQTKPATKSAESSGGSKGTTPSTNKNAPWREKPITDGQKTKLAVVGGKAGFSNDDMKGIVLERYGKKSRTELTQGEASDLIEEWEAIAKGNK